MATLAVLMGGALGFVGFLVSWIALGIGLLPALAVYFLVSLIVSAILLALTIAPSRKSEGSSQTA